MRQNAAKRQEVFNLHNDSLECISSLKHGCRSGGYLPRPDKILEWFAPVNALTRKTDISRRIPE